MAGRNYRFIMAMLAVAAGWPPPWVWAGQKGPPASKASLAIWHLGSPGVDAVLAKKIRTGLEQAAAGLGNFQVIREAVLEERLQKAGILPGAPWESVWPVMKVDWVLLGTLTGVEKELALDMRLMDGRQGMEVSRATVSLGPDSAERQNALAELVVRLLHPEKWKGSLLIDLSVEGARVFIDDREVATTPLAEPIMLTPGKHILRITREGYGEFSKFVFIRYNQTTALRVDLEKAMLEGLLYEQEATKAPAGEAKTIAPAPAGGGQLGRILAWSALGAGAALGGTGGVLLAMRRALPVGTVLVVSGGVLVAGSLTLFLIAPGPPPSSATAWATHSAVWGIGVAGTF